MKNKKQNSSRVRVAIGFVAISTLALGGLALGGFGTQTAMASDSKVISGHACAPLDKYNKTDRSHPEYIKNDGNSRQTYMCPIVRDDPKGKLSSVRIRTYNSSSGSGRPKCTVWSVSVKGGSSDMEMETHKGGGFDTLKFDLKSFTEYDFGHFVIECDLGENDRIISYRTTEK